MISNEWLAVVCINLEPVRPRESLVLPGPAGWRCPPTFRIETPSALIVMSDPASTSTNTRTGISSHQPSGQEIRGNINIKLRSLTFKD